MTLNSIDSVIDGVYKRCEYPSLDWQQRCWASSRPLEGMSLLDATPVFRNTLIKYRALLASGANLVVGISDVMPYDSNVVRLLEKAGVEVIDAGLAKGRAFDVVMDCAGAFASVEAKFGYVELTKSGEAVYKNCQKPVFVADGGEIKKIETCLGTGESYFRALRQLGFDDFSGKDLVVFGSGKVGTGIILHALRCSMCVTVITDLNTLREDFDEKLRAVSMNDSEQVALAVRNADFVVTATGVRGAVQSVCPLEAVLSSEAVFANMGVEDEFGESIEASRVLQNKQTVNFILEEPTQVRYIDATMALHNAGALYLVSNKSLERGLVFPPAEMEAKLFDVMRANGCISDELDLL